MSNYDAVLQSFEDLKGQTITSSGWDSLTEYLHTRPTYVAKDDFFTHAVEEMVVESRTGELVKLLGRTVRLFTELSTLDAPQDKQIHEVIEDASSLPVHVDVRLGDVFLGNFRVKGSPKYRLYTKTTENYHLFDMVPDEPLHVKADPGEFKEVVIKNRQLVVLNGSATQVYSPFKGEDMPCGLPHGVVFEAATDYRVLLMAHSSSKATEVIEPNNDVAMEQLVGV